MQHDPNLILSMIKGVAGAAADLKEVARKPVNPVVGDSLDEVFRAVMGEIEVVSTRAKAHADARRALHKHIDALVMAEMEKILARRADVRQGPKQASADQIKDALKSHAPLMGEKLCSQAESQADGCMTATEAARNRFRQDFFKAMSFSGMKPMCEEGAEAIFTANVSMADYIAERLRR